MTTGMLQPREQQRRRMLREMGIMPWIPREALPTAAPSHDMVFSLANLAEEESTEQLSPDVTQRVSNQAVATGHSWPGENEQGLAQAPAKSNSAAMDQARQLLGKTETQPYSKPKSSLAQQNQTESSDVPINGSADQHNQAHQSDQAEALAFNFTWVSVDDRLALLALMPGAETRIPAAQRDMMKRMLVALDPGIDTSNLKARLFRWPLPGFSNQGLAAATSAVNGFVAKQLNDRPTANLLVLSDSVPVFLEDSIQVGQMGEWKALHINVLCTHAMHEMVDSPSTKREAWQHMQALRQRLTSG